MHRHYQLEEKIYQDNWRKLNELAEFRSNQLKELYGIDWWIALCNDELYKFLCLQLTILKRLYSKIHGKLIQHTNDYNYDCTCGGKPVYIGSEWQWKCEKCGVTNYG